jgi:raffinose/stachyose/melibiose transport system substrate-binding protein
MKIRWHVGTLLLVCMMVFLTACGTDTPTATPVPPAPTATTAPVAAPTDTTAPVAAATDTTAPAAAATETPATLATATMAATAEPTATPGPVTLGTGPNLIDWWHISTANADRANWQALAEKYVKDHTDVSIKITVLENQAFKDKLATAMQSGSPPGLFQSWGGGVLAQYGEAGLVKDLTADLAKDGWGASFQPGPLGLYKSGDKAYGVPWNAGAVGFWYNKDLFAKAGITGTPTTWTEFLDAVKKLKAAGITPIALGEKDKWPGHFYWVYLATRIGGRAAFEAAYNRTGSFASEPFVQAGERLKELVDLQPFQTGFLGSDYPAHQVLIANQQAAMELMGQWALGADRAVATNVDVYNKNVGWFPFPTVAGGKGDPSDVLGGGDGFAIGKNAPAQTVDFVRYLTSLDVQKAMTKANLAVPVIKGAETELADPLLKTVQQTAGAAKYYQLYYDQYLPPALGNAVNDKVQELFAGTGSPQEVAQAIEDVAAQELKK